MQLSQLRLTKRMKLLDTALVFNLVYLFIVLIFKGLEGILPNQGTYSIPFGIIELIITFLYWVGFNWYIFKNGENDRLQTKVIYLGVTMLPILIFTLISSIIIYIFPSYDFGTAWNEFSFVISPTLFWYLPYGFLYYAFGFRLSIVLFMLICLIFTAALSFVGMMLGSAQHLHELEKEKALKLEQQRIARAKRAKAQVQAVSKPRVSPVRRRDTVLEARAANTYKKEEDRPFRERDTEQIIYTESISIITDDMLIEEEKNQKKDVSRGTKKADGTPNWEIPAKTRRRRHE